MAQVKVTQTYTARLSFDDRHEAFMAEIGRMFIPGAMRVIDYEARHGRAHGETDKVTHKVLLEILDAPPEL